MAGKTGTVTGVWAEHSINVKWDDGDDFTAGFLVKNFIVLSDYTEEEWI